MSYHFHKNVIIRNPRNSFNTDFDETFFLEKIKEESFLEAIYLASPSLYEACIRWKEGKVLDKKELQKILFSLAKYASRMSNRCTPFGLFAGVSVAKWGEETKAYITANPTRYTRLDMHFLCALAQRLALLPLVRQKLTYFPNSSIYFLNDEVRYIEYLYKNGTRVHQISSVIQNEYIDLVIKATTHGLSFTKLIDLLVGDEISYEDANSFINDLIDSQLLVSELDPAITGEEFTYQLIEILDRINIDNDETINFYSNSLKNIQHKLSKIDTLPNNSIKSYKDIIELIRPLGVSFEENHLFQTDMVMGLAEGASVSAKLQQDIIQTIGQIANFNEKNINTNLDSFAKRFYERYEDQEISLPIALDSEVGIGYLEKNTYDFTPLVEGIVLPNKDNETAIKLSKVQELLFRKIREANEQKLYEIAFDEADLPIKQTVWSELPPSLSVMFRLLNENEILLESIGGSSAAYLLGRFAHVDVQIKSMVREITAEEQKHNEEIIFAEIIHLPESRTGNILLHPAFRNYEIPYLAKSSLSDEHQLRIDDLLVSVRNGQIVLRSKRLNKIVVPRLSNAHNYSYHSLPIYQFLCELQHQNKLTSIGFDWGIIANLYTFLPRVRIKNVILEVATWKFTKKDFDFLNSSENENTMVAFNQFTQKWNLPRYFVLAESDNELLIDAENELLVGAFIDTIKNREKITLKEVLLHKNEGIKSIDNQLFSNQIVAALVADQSSFSSKLPQKETFDIQRTFSLGSEWLYFKIYCGIKTADKILLETIEPIVTEAEAKKLIDQWFFIRYDDPHFHLRVRFHLTDINRIGELLQIYHQKMSQMEANGLVWKMQADTYQREVERYGNNAITLAEGIFCVDSAAVFKFLSATIGDEREQLRWIFALKAIDRLLDSFGYEAEQKINLIAALKEGFATEFGMEQGLKSQLDKRYREYRQAIVSFDNEYSELLNILEERKEKIAPIAVNILGLKANDTLQVDLNNLLSSYIHMTVNRLISSNQRLHELVIYDFLYRQYLSDLARKKSHAKKRV
ncbi:MAG: lantibiotic dehydratase [Emticicia sp.]|uniref:lantibiotic dehydratase n=1 Tax=Emticicia sp. TaxID=1930953 RepID=UPI003BA3F480